ncbi:unnamed protein product [Moneuplotes crassus]|uniref:Uncharacterized protein n=1 Tax=Euplotes crassus TaxID=5936 RepID=A0AAD1Y6T5_EUPCR|nr:unnamed protein product [Moneuplotes crassus]
MKRFVLNNQIELLNWLGRLQHFKTASLYSDKLEPYNTSVIINKKKQNIKEISELKFNLDLKEHIELLKQLIPYKMPPLQDLTFDLDKTLQNTELLNEFLSNSICGHILTNSSCLIQVFNFRAPNSFLSISPYMASLPKVLPLVSEAAGFRDFSLEKAEFEDLLAAAKNVKKVEISWCSIEGSGQLDFGDKLEGSTFEILDFWGTIFKSEGDDRTSFMNIVKGLAEVESVRSREVKIRSTYCKWNKKKAQEVLEKYGLTKMSLDGN